jgi:hypothetical protein
VPDRPAAPVLDPDDAVLFQVLGDGLLGQSPLRRRLPSADGRLQHGLRGEERLFRFSGSASSRTLREVPTAAQIGATRGDPARARRMIGCGRN